MKKYFGLEMLPCIDLKLGQVERDNFDYREMETYVAIGYKNNVPVIAEVCNVEETRYGNTVTAKKTFEIESIEELITELDKMCMFK